MQCMIRCSKMTYREEEIAKYSVATAYHLSVTPLLFHQHLVMVFALFHGAHIAHTHAIVPAVENKRLVMARTELLRAMAGSVRPTRRSDGSVRRAVGGHFAQHGQGHVPVQSWSSGEGVFAEWAVERCILRFASLYPIPVFGYAFLAESVATRDSDRISEPLQADGAGQTVLLHDQSCLSGNETEMRLQTGHIEELEEIPNISLTSWLRHQVKSKHSVSNTITAVVVEGFFFYYFFLTYNDLQRSKVTFFRDYRRALKRRLFI